MHEIKYPPAPPAPPPPHLPINLLPPHPTVRPLFSFLLSGGQRKCVGDQFALMESVVTLSMLTRRFDFELMVKPEEVGFYTGATIHTRYGLPMRAKKRVFSEAGDKVSADAPEEQPVSVSSPASV